MHRVHGDETWARGRLRRKAVDLSSLRDHPGYGEIVVEERAALWNLEETRISALPQSRRKNLQIKSGTRVG